MALSQARIEVARLGAAIVRTLFGRALTTEMCWEGITPPGKFIDERIKAIEAAWCVDHQRITSAVDLDITPRKEPPKDESLERSVTAEQVSGGSGGSARGTSCRVTIHSTKKYTIFK